MSKHTPWHYGEQYADNGETEWIAIVDDEGRLIAKHIKERDAAHIVKCVNEHEALKQQVEGEMRLRKICEDYTEEKDKEVELLEQQVAELVELFTNGGVEANMSENVCKGWSGDGWTHKEVIGRQYLKALEILTKHTTKDKDHE